MRIRIITLPRTKATYLTKAITQAVNPEQFKVNSDYYNEPYNNRADPGAALEWMKRDQKAVVKHHIRHLVADDVYNSRQYFDQENQLPWYNVAVVRRDLFATAVSYCRSRMLNHWHSYSPQQVTIDPDLFCGSVLALWGSVVHIVRNEHRIPYDAVVYSEDFSFQPNQDVYLSTGRAVPSFDVDSTASPSNTVLNLDQLRDLASAIVLPQVDSVDVEVTPELYIRHLVPSVGRLNLPSPKNTLR